MIINNIKINNLRNLKSVDFDLHPGVNLLLGDNGAGKTSVLESIVVLAKGRSFRSGQITSLVGPDSDHFRVVATAQNSDRQQQTLGIERSANTWKARRNGSDVKQLSDLAIHLPLVLIEPNSHLIISGPPEGRRRFLDWGVFHVEHQFLLKWRRYSRALKQRNAALRQQKIQVTESLDSILSELGESIDAARQEQMKRLSECLEDTISNISPGLKGIHILYEKGWKGDSLGAALGESKQRDLDRCATGPGPHRADILIFQNKKPARERLSRGEQKVLSAALLLSQARLMSEAGEKPLLLMDDLASEFDEAHLDCVLQAGRQLETQLWITGTSPEPYGALGGIEYAMFHVEHGLITTETIA